MDGPLLGFDLLGIDAIRELGGVHINPSGEVQFSEESKPQCAAISIIEPNFSVAFDCRNKIWTSSWKWMNGQPPLSLKNRVTEYSVPDYAWDEYERDFSCGWIMDGCNHTPKTNLVHQRI